MFQVTVHEEDIVDSLTERMGKKNYHTNAYFGDGGEIDVEHLQVIRELNEKHQIHFDWQRNDVLLLDSIFHLRTQSV